MKWHCLHEKQLFLSLTLQGIEYLTASYNPTDRCLTMRGLAVDCPPNFLDREVYKFVINAEDYGHTLIEQQSRALGSDGRWLVKFKGSTKVGAKLAPADESSRELATCIQ